MLEVVPVETSPYAGQFWIWLVERDMFNEQDALLKICSNLRKVNINISPYPYKIGRSWLRNFFKLIAKNAVRSINGLVLVGDPKLCICSFTSREFNIYTLLSGKTLSSGKFSARHWNAWMNFSRNEKTWLDNGCFTISTGIASWCYRTNNKNWCHRRIHQGMFRHMTRTVVIK